MAPYNGSVNDRLEYLAHAGTIGCGATDGSLVQEVTIWRTVCEEAKTYVEARVPQPKFRNQSFLQVVNNHLSDIAKELQDFNRPLNESDIPCT
jgi:hypothetical protein